MRHLEVNGTAKVYFVAEKTGCHATMGPVVGVQRAPRDQEGYGHRQKGPSRSGETRRTAEEERQRGGGGGEYSSGSSSGSCRCQCPPSCYPRRGPPEDSGAGHGGSSGSQIFFPFHSIRRKRHYRRIEWKESERSIREDGRENVLEMDYPTGGSILLGGLVLLRSSLERVQLGVSARPTINASNVPREF